MYFFDLHCDTATVTWHEGKSLLFSDCCVSLPGAAGIERWIQTFAIFTPDTVRGEKALDWYRSSVKHLKDSLADSGGAVGFCASTKEIAPRLALGHAAILSVESAAPLAGDLENISEFASDGVQMVTITWNGENELGYGCDGHGRLKPFGREAVAEMIRRGIAVDVSHSSDEGFYDLLEMTDRLGGRILATHSNLRTVCNHRRNLTEEMFRLLAERGAVVGLNLNTPFLAELREKADQVDTILRHIDRMLELGGERAVAFGSDFDGASMPAYCQSLADIPALRDAVSCRFGEETADDIFYGNAARYFSVGKEE